MPSFSIVIPAYNEKRTIRAIVRDALNYSADVIVIDDGSTDNTSDEIDDLPITLIKHAVNMGKAASLLDGFTAAVNKGANAVVTLDGDGQHSPHDIPLLLSCAKQYPDDIIIGSRLADKKSIPKKRYYANRIANFWISWACGYRIADSQSGFRLYPCLLLDKLTTSLKKSKSFVLESEILIKAAHSGVHSHPVQIPAVYSENARPSHFRGVRDIVNITLMVATELLKRGLYIPGLYRAWIRPLTPASRYDQTGLDGYFTLLLSLLIIALSGGISYIATVIYTFNQARKIPYEMPAAATLYLILGRKLKSDTPDDDYRKRLDRVIALMKNGKNNRALILGGYTGCSTISESSAGKNYMTANGIPSEHIAVEESSRNTLENLQHAKLSIQSDDRKLALVSNRYHLPRGLAFASGFSITVTPCPAEKRLDLRLLSALKIASEAFHLHWYFTGKYFARLTNNQKMLARIS
jgi:glycosyltransferase involved in cell wall biosynthesis